MTPNTFAPSRLARGWRFPIGLAVALVAFAVVAVGASAGTRDAARSHAERSLVFADAGEPGTVDPAIGAINWEHHVTWNVYDTLTTYSLSNMAALRPALATSWAGKGKVWTFHLRKGVTFQDGQPFGANDVKASLDRMLKINQGSAYLIGTVASVVVVDPYTVRITTKVADSFLAGNLSHIGIVSAGDITKHAEGADLAQAWFKQNANGTGPYKLGAWQKGSQLTLERNTGWWGKFAVNAPDKVIVKFVTDGATRSRGLEGGAYDFADFVSLDDVMRIAKKPGFALVRGNNLFAWPAIYLNLTTLPTSNAKFREAIVSSFDYAAETTFYQGNNTVPRGPLPGWYPGSPEKQFPPIKMDLSAAKAALTASGLGTPGFTCAVPAGFPEFDFAATNLQSSAKALGITVDVKTMPFAQALDAISSNKAQCFILGNATLSPQDPTAFLVNYTKGALYNVTHYSNPTFEKLLSQIRGTFDAKARNLLVKKAFGMIRSTQLNVWAARPLAAYVVPKYLTGFKVDPASYTGIRFAEMSFNK